MLPCVDSNSFSIFPNAGDVDLEGKSRARTAAMPRSLCHRCDQPNVGYVTKEIPDGEQTTHGSGQRVAARCASNWCNSRLELQQSTVMDMHFLAATSALRWLSPFAKIFTTQRKPPCRIRRLSRPIYSRNIFPYSAERLGAQSRQ